MYYICIILLRNLVDIPKANLTGIVIYNIDHSYLFIHETMEIGSAQSNIDCPCKYIVPSCNGVMFIIVPNTLQKHKNIIFVNLT